MAKWISAGTVQDFPPGSKQCLELEGTPVVLANVEGQLRAIHNVCPHAGLPLGDGDMRGCTIICPYHGYTYDMRDGRNVDFSDDMPATVLPVRVTEDNQVQVDVEPADDD